MTDSHAHKTRSRPARPLPIVPAWNLRLRRSHNRPLIEFYGVAVGVFVLAGFEVGEGGGVRDRRGEEEEGGG